MKTVKNPWYSKDNPYSKKTFEYPDAPLFSYRSVDVFESYSGSFDFVLGDTAITQRCGFGKDSAPSIIDEMLDGLTPVSDAVAAHISAHGFTPMTYSEYMVEFSAGRMA